MDDDRPHTYRQGARTPGAGGRDLVPMGGRRLASRGETFERITFEDRGDEMVLKIFGTDFNRTSN